MEKVMLLLSGGMDSTLLLHELRKQGKEVICLFVNYGQKAYLSERFMSLRATGTGPPLIEIRANLQYGGLLRSDIHKGLMNEADTVVPCRNMMLLSLAAHYAVGRGIKEIYVGFNADDNEAYADCRGHFIDAVNTMLKMICNEQEAPTVVAPYLTLTKVDLWKKIEAAGLTEIIRDNTISDYNGDMNIKHIWGYGSLNNAASKKRAEAYSEAFWNEEIIEAVPDMPEAVPEEMPQTNELPPLEDKQGEG